MADNEFERALDRLDKFDFFNQRVGRELWSDKPTDVQDKDIEDYSKDINFLKSFFYNQQAKIKALKMDNEQLQSDIVKANGNCDKLQNDCELLKTALAQKVVSEIKSEAIKEFSDSLIEKLGECRLVNNYVYVGYNTGDVLKAIDNLVNEMVGENK